MKSILLVIHTNTYFNNLLPLARMLKRTGIYEPVLYFAASYPTLSLQQELCASLGIAYLGARPTRPSATIVSRTLRSIRGRLNSMFAFCSNSVCAAVLVVGHTRNKVRRIIRELRTKLVIFPADNRYDIAVFVRAAHDEGVPVLVAPAFMAASREWAQAVKDVPAYSANSWRNALVTRYLPEWRHEYQGQSLVALPPSQIIARKLFGVAPPLPWTLHSGFADAIAVESSAMKDFCVSEGIPEQQIVVTGSMDHDSMADLLRHRDQRRNELNDKYKLDRGRAMLLTALPPDQLAGRGRKECDFDSYEELVRFWLSTLAQFGTGNVLVSLHPSVARSSFAHIEQWGVKIADQHVSSLIPLCDVYVASISATIQWAIAAGVPVINYDVYRYRYPEYQKVPGVLSMEKQGIFRDAVRRISHDTVYTSEIRASIQSVASYWGVLDGKAETRLLSLIESLISRANETR